MMVSVNGPSPAQRDHVVMAAMRQHFKERHGIRFVRRSNEITVFDRTGPTGISKDVYIMLQEKSRLPDTLKSGEKSKLK